MNTEPNETGFTLLELLMVVLISGVIAISVSVFLQRSVSTFRRVDKESELAGRVKFALDRLRSCIRHSLSPPANFQSTHPAIEPTETLFFITNMDQDGNQREVHFVWLDRYDLTNNVNGTNQLLHAWQDVGVLHNAQPTFDTLVMPPDMTAVGPPSFALLLAYLRNPANFNSGGPPTVREGWEVLIDAPYPRPVGAPTITKPPLPVHLGRWTPPPGTPSLWPTLGSDPQRLPPSGIAFNVLSYLVVTPGSPATFSYVDAKIPAPRSSLLNELCRNAGAPYPQAAAGTSFGSPSVQVYIHMFADENLSSQNDYYTALEDTEEANVQFMTTLNMLLVPSAGWSSP